MLSARWCWRSRRSWWHSRGRLPAWWSVRRRPWSTTLSATCSWPRRSCRHRRHRRTPATRRSRSRGPPRARRPRSRCAATDPPAPRRRPSSVRRIPADQHHSSSPNPPTRNPHSPRQSPVKGCEMERQRYKSPPIASADAAATSEASCSPGASGRGAGTLRRSERRRNQGMTSIPSSASSCGRGLAPSEERSSRPLRNSPISGMLCTS